MAGSERQASHSRLRCAQGSASSEKTLHCCQYEQWGASHLHLHLHLHLPPAKAGQRRNLLVCMQCSQSRTEQQQNRSQRSVLDVPAWSSSSSSPSHSALSTLHSASRATSKWESTCPGVVQSEISAIHGSTERPRVQPATPFLEAEGKAMPSCCQLLPQRPDPAACLFPFDTDTAPMPCPTDYRLT